MSNCKQCGRYDHTAVNGICPKCYFEYEDTICPKCGAAAIISHDVGITCVPCEERAFKDFRAAATFAAREYRAAVMLPTAYRPPLRRRRGRG